MGMCQSLPLTFLLRMKMLGQWQCGPICTKTLGDSSMLRKRSTNLGGPLTACSGKPVSTGKGALDQVSKA